MSFAINPDWIWEPILRGGDIVYGDMDLEPNRLDNPIHSIWAYRNWSRAIRFQNVPAYLVDTNLVITAHHCRPLPIASYERLKPALRLASLFLEKSLPWLWSVLHAPYQHSGTPPDKTSLKHDFSPWTQEREIQVREALEDMSQRYFIIHGINQEDLLACGATTYSTRQLDSGLLDIIEDPDDVRSQYRSDQICAINFEFIEFICSANWRLVPLQWQKRVMFSLAQLLVHELCHSAVYYRLEEICGDDIFFSGDEPAAELGRSWEHFMFGGMIYRLDTDPWPVRGPSLTQWDWPHRYFHHLMYMAELKPIPTNDTTDGGQSHLWMIVSQDIERLFDRRIWDTWLAMQLKHGKMSEGPFTLQLTPMRSDHTV